MKVSTGFIYLVEVVIKGGEAKIYLGISGVNALFPFVGTDRAENAEVKDAVESFSEEAGWKLPQCKNKQRSHFKKFQRDS